MATAIEMETEALKSIVKLISFESLRNNCRLSSFLFFFYSWLLISKCLKLTETILRNNPFFLILGISGYRYRKRKGRHRNPSSNLLISNAFEIKPNSKASFYSCLCHCCRNVRRSFLFLYVFSPITSFPFLIPGI